MANTRDLRRRIRSVKNTAQLTRAMKMVAAAKLRRAQEAMLASRPFSAGLRNVLAEVAKRAHPESHLLLTQRPLQRVDLIVLTGDKGLCGAFNTNILKAAELWRHEKELAGVAVEVTAVGRKAGDFYRRRPHIKLRETLSDVFRRVEFATARELATRMEARFVAGQTDAVYIAFNEFRSVISQKVTVRPLLPLGEMLDGNGSKVVAGSETDYIYEPSAEEILNGLLPRFVAFQIFHSMLESVAAEHGARMSAMDSATRNANDMIATLTLNMNRVRQAAITKEIIEVVSGAAALG